MEGGKFKMEISLFETTEICLGVYQKLKFLARKKHFTLGENQEKWFYPPEKYFSYTPLPVFHINL